MPDFVDLDETVGYDYDQWLELFRKKPATWLKDNIQWIEDNLPADGYAAAKRWLDIFDNPGKMEKLYKARIDTQKEEDIMEIATGDDDERFYEALIRKNTAQLSSSNISQQEVARLSQNINIFRKELREIRSRHPKTGTTLEKVLKKAATANSLKKPVEKYEKTPKTARNVAGATKKKKMTNDTSGAVKNATKKAARQSKATN